MYFSKVWNSNIISALAILYVICYKPSKQIYLHFFQFGLKLRSQIISANFLHFGVAALATTWQDGEGQQQQRHLRALMRPKGLQGPIVDWYCFHGDRKCCRLRNHLCDYLLYTFIFSWVKIVHFQKTSTTNTVSCSARIAGCSQVTVCPGTLGLQKRTCQRIIVGTVSLLVRKIKK